MDFWAGILGLFGAGDFGGIKVGWVVFGEDFTFGHGGLESEVVAVVGVVDHNDGWRESLSFVWASVG